eukprot:242616-Chlamydomonas_euryale.AAC.2
MSDPRPMSVIAWWGGRHCRHGVPLPCKATVAWCPSSPQSRVGIVPFFPVEALHSKLLLPTCASLEPVAAERGRAAEVRARNSLLLGTESKLSRPRGPLTPRHGSSPSP